MTQTKHPNLLIIITDQERKTQHFPNGWEQKNLPNMTLLKQYGMDFEQAQCNTCMCTPSRSVLFTGKYPSETGMTATLSFGGPQASAEQQLDPRIPNMATMLNSVYDVQYRGKWHLSKGKTGENSLTHAEVGLYGFMGWVAPDAGEDSKNVNFGGGYANHDHYYVNQAIEYVKQHEEQRKIKEASGETVKPFCLVLSLVNPHDVLAYPKDFIYGYKDRDLLGDIELPESWDENLQTNKQTEAPVQQNAEKISAMGGLPYMRQKRYYLNFYGNLLKKIDGEIGRLLDLFYNPLQEGQDKRSPRQLARDTWILRTSDHGELGMTHGGLRQKAFNVYEETLRVPLTFSNPDYFPMGKVSKELVGLVDVMPTVASLLGMEAAKPEGLRGTDMSPVILGKQAGPDYKGQEGVLFTFDDVKAGSPDNPSSVDAPNRIRCVRTRRYKYARYFIAEGQYADEFEMYDLLKDPNELENVGNPQHPDYDQYAEERAELQALLEKLELEKMRVPSVRERTVAGSSSDEPRLTPIFTEKGVAYQVDNYYLTGFPTQQGFAAAEADAVKTAINLSGREVANVDGINIIQNPIDTSEPSMFMENMASAVTLMGSEGLPLLVFDLDSDLTGAAWACFNAKTKSVEAAKAIARGMQVGLRNQNTIELVKQYIHS